MRILERGQSPSIGFVRRERPIFPEFALRMTWFTRQEWERNGDPDTFYVWVLASENREYQRGYRRTRFCLTYRRKTRKNLESMECSA